MSVIPHDAESDTIAKHLRGKCPGTRKPDGKWVGTAGAMAERHMTEAEAKIAHRAGAAIGLLGRSYPALAIDTALPALAQEVADLAETILGPAPVRGREGSPRRLLMYRGEGHRKRRLEFRRPDHKEGDKLDAIEWLGAGSYYNVCGVHPSGKPYRWSEPHPCDLGPEGLSEADPDGVAVLFEALPGALARHGCVTGRESTAGAPGSRKRIGDPALCAPSPQHILDLLAAAPCTGGRFKDRHDIVAWLCGVKASFGAEHEEHRAAVLEWFLQYPGAEEEYFTKIWDSIKDAAVGWDWLDATSGAGITAQADFADAPEVPNIACPVATAEDRMFSENIYLASLDRFLHIPTGIKRKPKAFNAAYTDNGQFGSRQTAEAAFLNDKMRGRRYDSVTYRPGQDLIVQEIDRETGVSTEMVNLWKSSTLERQAATDAEVAPFLNHVKMHMPKEESERRTPDELSRAASLLLDWMAFIVQHPGEKVNYIVAVVGEAEGTGKDAMFEPLRRIVGEHNAATVNGTALRREFNAKYLQKQMVIFNEVQGLTPAEMNQIKELGAAPPHTLWVNEKNSPEYPIPNIINCVMLSNHLDALAPGKHDRRYLILHSRVEKVPSEGYFKTLWDWFKGDGCAKVYGWLKARDISAFNPNKPAAMTSLKAQMIRSAEPAPVRWCRDLFQEGGPFDGRMIMTVEEVLDSRERSRTAPREVTHKSAAAALAGEGFVTNEKLRVRVGKGSPKRLWIRDSSGLKAQLSPERLKELYLAEKAERASGGGDWEDFA